MKKVQILQSAIDDLAYARRFYEQQGSHVGEYFFNTLFADIDSLSLYAGIHQQYFGFYRLLSNRFPYAVYYKVNNETALVYRVLDLRSSPKKLVKALKHNLKL